MTLDPILKQRIDLLYDSKQITEEVFKLLPQKLSEVEDYLEIELTEENAGSFVTHLAVALQRIKENKELDNSTEELSVQVKKFPNYFEFAKKLLTVSDFNKDSSNIDAEASYIVLYCCLLTGKE